MSDLPLRRLLDLLRPAHLLGSWADLEQLASGHAPSCTTGGSTSRRERCLERDEPCDPFEGISIEETAALVTAIAPIAELGDRLGADVRKVLILCSKRLADEINERSLEEDPDDEPTPEIPDHEELDQDELDQVARAVVETREGLGELPLRIAGWPPEERCFEEAFNEALSRLVALVKRKAAP